MLGLVKEINGEKKILPLTTDTGTGAPVGTLVQQYKKVAISGYLYCDGSTFDQNAYPALYMYLGTNVLPDYRECVMVGAEQNTTDTIATHDVYTQGQFKDDQMQNITVDTSDFKVDSGTGHDVGMATGGNSSASLDKFLHDSNSGRTGTTTHGKQKAVYVYIKATRGLAENQQYSVLRAVKDYGDNSNSYSTEEVKTGGTWIDGKPIYRNVLTTTELLNGESTGWAGVESDVASLNIDACIRCFAIAVGDGSRHLQFMPAQGGFRSYYSGLNPGSKIILEYTKTTD